METSALDKCGQNEDVAADWIYAAGLDMHQYLASGWFWPRHLDGTKSRSSEIIQDQPAGLLACSSAQPWVSKCGSGRDDVEKTCEMNDREETKADG